MSDKLDDIIEAQTAFMDKIGVPRRQIETKFPLGTEIQQFIPQIMFALVCELGEIGDEINWKHWKKTQKEVNMIALRMELTDALHFMLELMIMCGMTSETIHKEYFKKMQENLDRQKRGY